MKTRQQILAEIRELKREMKASGVRVISFMNAGLTRAEYAANATLFRLKTELAKA